MGLSNLDYEILMNEKNIDNTRMLLRSSLKRFIQFFHRRIWNEDFIFKDFHNKIILELENYAFGRNEKANLYIGMPPRFGKSRIAEYFNGWGYVLNPYCNNILTSASEELVSKLSDECRMVFNDECFKRLFSVAINPQANAKGLWTTTAGGSFRAASMGGMITGFGAGTATEGWGGALVIDDFMKANDSISVVVKKRVIQLYEGVLKTRKNKPETPTIIIAQRLAKDDLIGYLEETYPDDWLFLTFPAVNEEKGTCVWENRIRYKDLMRMKEVTPFVYYSQYQQTPIVLGGDIFKTKWWNFYKYGVEMEGYRTMFMVADTAMKTGQSNDFTAIGLFGVTREGSKLRLLELVHGKFEAPDLEREMVAFWSRYRLGHCSSICKPSALYIEDKASGTGLIQSIQKHGGIPVIPLMPNRDKLSRAMDTIPHIEGGNVLLPDNASNPISRKVINECEEFCADMSHSHDDIIDVISYAVQIAFYS